MRQVHAIMTLPAKPLYIGLRSPDLNEAHACCFAAPSTNTFTLSMDKCRYAQLRHPYTLADAV